MLWHSVRIIYWIIKPRERWHFSCNTITFSYNVWKHSSFWDVLALQKEQQMCNTKGTELFLDWNNDQTKLTPHQSVPQGTYHLMLLLLCPDEMYPCMWIGITCKSQSFCVSYNPASWSKFKSTVTSMSLKLSETQPQQSLKHSLSYQHLRPAPYWVCCCSLWSIWHIVRHVSEQSCLVFSVWPQGHWTWQILLTGTGRLREMLWRYQTQRGREWEGKIRLGQRDWDTREAKRQRERGPV